MRPAARLDVVLALLLALCIVRFWLMPLPSSFWVDEMGTVFVVHHGAADPSLRAAPQVADSVYYVLPKLAEKMFGFSEVSYRLFSVLAMCGALLAIALLAIKLIGPGAGWCAAFACLASRNFDYQAADARPYALGTLVLCIALLELVRWFDDRSWLDGLAFAFCASLLWWVHLAFWPFYLIFIAYGAFRIYARNAPPPAQIATLAAIVGLGCTLPLLRSLALLRGASAHVIVPVPSLTELFAVLKLVMVAGVCGAAAVLSRWLTGPRASIRNGAAVLILAWWLADPLVLFLFSRVAESSLFVPRYMYLALPGSALAACLLAGALMPARFWKPIAVILGIFALIFTGHWKKTWPDHQSSDWRAASARLREWAAGEPVPVICPSPFVEARPPVWKPDYPRDGFLYSNLDVYPTAGRIYPFPFEFSPAAESFAHTLTGGTLAPEGRFALFGGDKAVRFWRRWFASQPALSRWNSTVLAWYGDVELVAFTGPGAR